MSVTVKDNIVTINGSCYVKHDYYIHKAPVLLTAIYRATKNIDRPIIKFIFSDGEPIGSVNFKYVLDQIVKKLTLAPDQLIIETHDTSFVYPDGIVRYSKFDFLERVLEHLEPWKNIDLDSSAVLYGGLYGRFSISRFLLAYYLETEFPTDSFVTFHPKKDFIEFEFSGNESHFSKELEWYYYRSNNKGTLPSDNSGGLARHGWVSIHEYKHFWPKYLIEIIAETATHSCSYITDKTFRCLLTKKPFLLYGGSGTLKYLRTLGFKTFDGIIDESYDLEVDDDIRLEMIQKEMQRISNLSNDAREKLFRELEPNLKYNQDNYRSITKDYRKS